MSIHSIIGGNGTIGEVTVRHLAADAYLPSYGANSAGVNR